MGGYWQPSDGDRSIDLDGAVNVPGMISQTINTVVGQTYLVDFDIAGNPDNASYLIKSMTLEAAGQSQIFTFDITGKTRSSMGWENRSWQFIANSSSTEIKFYSNHPVNTAGWGMTLDNVSVTHAVPEPLTILGAGTAIAFGAKFKRKLAKNSKKK